MKESEMMVTNQQRNRHDRVASMPYLTLVETVTEERVEKPNMAVLSIDYLAGQWRVENLAGKDAGLLERLAKQ